MFTFLCDESGNLLQDPYHKANLCNNFSTDTVTNLRKNIQYDYHKAVSRKNIIPPKVS